jgi:cytochrome c oxidase subunit 5b
MEHRRLGQGEHCGGGQYLLHGASRLTTVTEVKTEEDLVGPGALPGTVPTDVEQATGLERLEILGKMEGVDVFDMRPLDASRRGTLGHPPRG